MKRYFGFAMCFVLVLCSTSFAQVPAEEQKCSVGDLGVLEHRDGVTVRTASFTELAKIGQSQEQARVTPQKVMAHLYITDGDAPLPLILFSHSAIHSYKGTTDLLPFAMAMARAGAASLVLDRTIKWEPFDEAANRDHSVMECAALWMTKQIRVDEQRVGTSGSYMFQQRSSNGTTNWGLISSAGYGFLTPAEQLNTKYMMSASGQLKIAAFFSRALRLSAVKPEWLKVETIPDDPLTAAN